jgi:PAS domain S-box-containing protein
MLLLGIALAAACWLLTAAVASLYTPDFSFVELLIGAGPAHSIAIRLLIVALLVAVGFLSSLMCGTLQRAHNSQQALEAMMLASPTAMVLISPQRAVMRTNPPALCMLGLDAEHVVGQLCHDLMAEGVCEYQQCPVQRVLDGQMVLLEEVTVAGGNGEQIPCLLSATPVPSSDGSTEAVLLSLHDISEHKHMQQALAESEDRYRSLVESAPISIVIIQDGIVRYVNNHAILSSGYSSEQLVGATITQHLPTELQAEMQQLHQQRIWLAESGEKVEPLEITATVIAADGTRQEVDVASVVIPHEGRPAGLLTIREITVARQAERALAAEKERLQVTMRALSEGVITVDTDGRIVLINRAAQKLIGYPQERVLHRPVTEVLKLYDEYSGKPLTHLIEQILKPAAAPVELQAATLLTADGDEHAVAIASAPVNDPDSQTIGAVIVLRDTTALRRQAEQQRRIETLEAIGLLAGGIAHDFNNLLTGFFGNITLARLALQTGGDADERLSAAERSLERARELTERLLTFASGGRPVRTRICLSTLLQEAVDAAVDGGSERCLLEIHDALWPVEVDEGQLHQAIVNLVRNADEATGGNGQVKIAANNLRVSADDLLPLPPGEYVRISVQDRGPAIPRNMLPRIFEPYFTTKPGGTGLGLPVAFSIMRRHKGHLEIDSDAESGTMAHMYIPAAEAPADSLLQPAAVPDADEVTDNPLRILIMDDDELIRTALTGLLEQLGHHVKQSSNGAEALRMYREAMEAGKSYSLVIMDLTIPGGMGGKEAAGRLRQIDPAARIIVSSGYSTDPIMSAYAEHGFDGVMAKPYRIEDLHQVVHAVMGSSRASS